MNLKSETPHRPKTWGVGSNVVGIICPYVSMYNVHRFRQKSVKVFRAMFKLQTISNFTCKNGIAIPQLSCLLYFHEFSRHNSHFRFSPQEKFCAHSFINFLETLALCRIILVASSVFTSFSVFIASCVKCDG